MTRTFRMVLQYDGTGYVGWQRQERGESIQGLVEAALARIDGKAVTVHGAGRTDAGVHALAQTASVRLDTTLDPSTLGRALNANLPPAIRVTAVDVAGDEFHARFDARSKTYEYRIRNAAAVPPFERLYVWRVAQRLDLDTMQRAASPLVGQHDFGAFQGAGTEVHTTVRRVLAARWQRSADGLLVFEITGEGFLRHMVRRIVGTLVEIGSGRRPESEIARLLESGPVQDVARTAPACGLFLVRVEY
jgi:tRNA pseudouridine38-40 synthase